MAAKRALVTGANGFLGRHVGRHLAAHGYRVTGIGHGVWLRDCYTDWGLSEWICGDVSLRLLSETDLDPELIVHCAGGGAVGFSVEHPYQDFQRTVNSTLAVLEYCRATASGARIVYPSSAAVYGVCAEQPINESSAVQPISPYGSHKAMAEQLCRSYARSFGLSLAVVRLFSVYGPELRKQLLWDACNKITAGDNEFFGSGGELRDWLHVEDAADLLRCAARLASEQCPVVNGGTGVGTSVADLLTELFAHFRNTPKPRFIGRPRRGDPQHFVADVTTALYCGWQPQIAWRTGVRAYADWFKNDASSTARPSRTAAPAPTDRLQQV